ncbi:MAG: hypothetical protein WB341_12405 [Terracidiphilus sp.]
MPPVQTLTPFSAGPSSSASVKLIEFRSEGRMTGQDRELAASAEPSIREGAALAGIEFDKGTWTYQQLVCQALPGHVLLLFKSNNGAGDISLFSAAISRSGKGRVRIIPIERRGFSLYSPAPVNPLTIAAFNRIRDDEPAKNTADWLSTAECYAALTGAHPETSPQPENSAGASLSLSFPPTLEVGSLGEWVVRFVDVAAPRQPMEWALTFDSKGELLKVTNFATPAFLVKPIPSLPAQQSSAEGSR